MLTKTMTEALKSSDKWLKALVSHILFVAKYRDNKSHSGESSADATHDSVDFRKGHKYKLERVYDNLESK